MLTLTVSVWGDREDSLPPPACPVREVAEICWDLNWSPRVKARQGTPALGSLPSAGLLCSGARVGGSGLVGLFQLSLGCVGPQTPGLLVTLLTSSLDACHLFGFLKKITFYEGRDRMLNGRLAEVESEQLRQALLLGQPKVVCPELPPEGPAPWRSCPCSGLGRGWAAHTRRAPPI